MKLEKNLDPPIINSIIRYLCKVITYNFSMGNANTKANMAQEEQQLAAQKQQQQQEANATAFAAANQKATDDEANRMADLVALHRERDRLDRQRIAEWADQAAQTTALEEEKEKKFFFHRLLEEDGKSMEEKKKAKKEKQKKKREAEEQLENFQEVCIPTALLLFVFSFVFPFWPSFSPPPIWDLLQGGSSSR